MTDMSSAHEHELPPLFPVYQRGKLSSFCCARSRLIRAVTQFDLVEKKELAPLDELNVAILAEDKAR